MTTITIPASVCYNGRWLDAHWRAQHLDNGAVMISATMPGPGLIPLTAICLSADDLAQLRRISDRPTEQPAPDGSRVLCYDCRTTDERLTALEQMLTDDAHTFGEHARRIEKLEQMLAEASDTE
jgi:hypothetical protein